MEKATLQCLFATQGCPGFSMHSCRTVNPVSNSAASCVLGRTLCFFLQGHRVHLKYSIHAGCHYQSLRNANAARANSKWLRNESMNISLLSIQKVLYNGLQVLLSIEDRCTRAEVLQCSPTAPSALGVNNGTLRTPLNNWDNNFSYSTVLYVVLR